MFRKRRREALSSDSEVYDGRRGDASVLLLFAPVNYSPQRQDDDAEEKGWPVQSPTVVA